MINGVEYKMEKKEPGKRLSSEQVAAINLEKRLGKEIAQDYPKIADDYRQGSTLREITDNYNFAGRYGFNYKIITVSLVYALKILILREERKSLEIKHKENVGRKAYEEEKGIFAQSKEKLEQSRRKGGRKGGRISYEKGKGIHALSAEEKIKFGRKSALLRGQKFFSDEEKRYLFELCENPEYHYEIGPQKGRPRYNLISEELQRRFGINRSRSSLQTMISRSRKITK